jgi:hypothetical protein
MLDSLCADLDDFRHCERETATTQECLECCQSAHFTIPLQERECEILCPITHGKRQLNNWLREYNACDYFHSTDLCSLLLP